MCRIGLMVEFYVQNWFGGRTSCVEMVRWLNVTCRIGLMVVTCRTGVVIDCHVQNWFGGDYLVKRVTI